MSVAKTILSQIKAIDFFALGAWGAKNLTNTGDGLQFKTSGSVKWKGFVHVIYDYADDLYDIEFFRIRAGKKIVDKKLVGIFAEDMVTHIDEQVG